MNETPWESLITVNNTYRLISDTSTKFPEYETTNKFVETSLPYYIQITCTTHIVYLYVPVSPWFLQPPVRPSTKLLSHTINFQAVEHTTESFLLFFSSGNFCLLFLRRNSPLLFSTDSSFLCPDNFPLFPLKISLLFSYQRLFFPSDNAVFCFLLTIPLFFFSTVITLFPHWQLPLFSHWLFSYSLSHWQFPTSLSHWQFSYFFPLTSSAIPSQLLPRGDERVFPQGSLDSGWVVCFDEREGRRAPLFCRW